MTEYNLASQAAAIAEKYSEARIESVNRFGDALEAHLSARIIERASLGKRCLRINFQKIRIVDILVQPLLDEFTEAEWVALEWRMLIWAERNGFSYERRESDPWRVKLLW